MSLIPITFRSENLAATETDTTTLSGSSGDFSEALTVGGLPVLLSGQPTSLSGQFSTSVSVASGITSTSHTYASLGYTGTYSFAPQVIASLRFSSLPENFYSFSTYNVTKTGFGVAFSDTIMETGNHLDIIVNAD